MRRSFGVFAVCMLLVASAASGVGAQEKPPPPPPSASSPPTLAAYTATVDFEGLAALRAEGFDISATRDAGDDQVEVELILADFEAVKLRSQGIDLQARAAGDAGRAGVRAFAAPAGDGVYRTYGGPGGLKEEVEEVARNNRDIVKLVTIGQSVDGQDIVALKVTKNARRIRDGSRPAVLYLSAQHAREWITPEVNRRLLHHIVDNYRTDRELRRLVDRNELWFVIVANPDGYDWTFNDGQRLWRKNLRDNDGDGAITNLDGVDLNRNFATNWGYDDEGSSPDLFSQTYRGAAPGSEPETQALDRLFQRIGFEFVVNFHSAAELLLYGVGWQVDTRTPDDLAYEALLGDDANPAVAGYDPDLSAELYITNGDTTDHAHATYGTMAITPELSTCETISAIDPADEWDPGDCQSVFNFPDDEDFIQAEFEKNLPFALDVARSAKDPANPVSHLGLTAPDFEVDAFDVSYGSTQTVQAFAERGLGEVELHYRINGGKIRSADAREWDGGERYGDTFDVHYRTVRGTVRGAQPGDSVEVWFSADDADDDDDDDERGGARSESFTYQVAEASGADVLLVADTDYGNVLSGGVSELRYVDEHGQALTDNGLSWTVYDVTARNAAPHPLGVLSHFDAVVYFTGDNLVTDYQGGFNTVKRAHDINIALRDYLNEGGKVLVSGKNAGFQEFFPLFYGTNGDPDEPCHSPDPFNDCLVMTDDVYQYYLGGYARNRRGGLDNAGNALPIEGTDAPLGGLELTLDGPDSARNQGAADGSNRTGTGTASWITTSSILGLDEFPQFASSRSARWASGGAPPYEPLTGDFQVASQQSDVAYKRLTRTIDLTGASSGALRFWTSYDIEADWDQFFVEAHTVGQDDWTTLPEASGITSQDTGLSCTNGWNSLHPFLDNYQTLNPDGTCSPTGATGEWHSVNGQANWQEWTIDLSAYAGEQVEVSLTYATDWATQGLGVYIDDVSVVKDGAVVETTSFEAGLDGWSVPGAPSGSAPNPNDWIRTGSLFEISAAVTTEDSVLLGFGLEGVTGADARAELMGAVMDHLLAGLSDPDDDDDDDDDSEDDTDDD